MLKCLPPILPPHPRLLVLGSMPSTASLAAGQYYAHLQNAFWPLILELIGESMTADYDRRITILKRAGIGLWDVLAACERTGSLDSTIVASSEQINHIVGLLRRFSSIRAVALNGGKARQYFMRYIQPHFGDLTAPVILFLPSTSPANARMTRAQKLAAWKKITPFLRP